MSKLLGNEMLGKNIKRIRLACGLTQEQTVAKLQVLGSPLSSEHLLPYRNGPR